MSFLPINEQNQQAPTGQTTNAPAGNPPPVSSGSAGTATGGGGAKGSITASPIQFGSSASKLGDYLSANAPQITNQANAVAGKFNDQYSQLNQGIQNAANQFNQQVQGGYAAPDQNIVNQAVSNPTQFTATPENIAKFQAQYNNQYTGPQNFEGSTPYSDIQGQVSNAVNQGNLLQSQAGLASYLQGQSKNPTKASSTLDSLLLSGNPEAQQTVQNAGKQFNNLTGQLETATGAANQGVQSAKDASAAAAKYAQDTFNPYVQNFGNQLTQGAQTAEAGRNAYNTSLNNFYGSAVPIEQQINQWAGTLPGGQSVNDLIAPIIAANNQGENINPITAQNYATPEQYAQAQAIQQLLGGKGQLPIDQTTVNQAGTAGKNGNPLPNISDILAQYKPGINAAEQAAINAVRGTPGNVGDVAINKINSDYSQLAKYLNQYNPTAYPLGT